MYVYIMCIIIYIYTVYLFMMYIYIYIMYIQPQKEPDCLLPQIPMLGVCPDFLHESGLLAGRLGR